MAATVVLTMGELDRLQIMTRLAERRLTRRRAAALLGLSERQVRRLYRAFQREGAAGLASRRRGRPSNRRLAPTVRAQALALVCERYVDFGADRRHARGIAKVDGTPDPGRALSFRLLRTNAAHNRRAGGGRAGLTWVPGPQSGTRLRVASRQTSPGGHTPGVGAGTGGRAQLQSNRSARVRAAGRARRPAVLGRCGPGPPQS